MLTIYVICENIYVFVLYYCNIGRATNAWETHKKKTYDRLFLGMTCWQTMMNILANNLIC